MTDATTSPPPGATRRTVVVAAGLTGAAVAAPVGLRALPDLLGGPAATTAPLTRAGFAPHLGKTFTAVAGDRRTQLELTGLLDLVGLPGDDDSFLAQFSSSADLEQDVYEVSRRGFAATPLLLVPGAPGDRTVSAVFNREKGPR